MPFVNYASREIGLKIVVAGPVGSGKADVARSLYDAAPEKDRGRVTSCATEGDPMLLLDFLSPWVERGFRARVFLSTLPDIARYELSAKYVLKGVDGILFVAGPLVSEELAASFSQLERLLERWNLDPNDVPTAAVVLDADAERLKAALNRPSIPVFTGPTGALEALGAVVKLVLLELVKPQSPAEPPPARKNRPRWWRRWMRRRAPGPL